MQLKRVKVITSHRGVALFLAECDEPIPGRHIRRSDCAHIPSPYRYSPTVTVYEHKGRNVAIFETRHRRFEVFEIPGELVRP